MGVAQKIFIILCGVLTLAIVAVSGLSLAEELNAQTVSVATTTVIVSLCGDGLDAPNEVCDFGTIFNVGGYSITIAERNCTPECLWAPYCGDGIVQASQSEECDDGTNTDEGYCTIDCKSRSVIGPRGSGPGGGGAFPSGTNISPGNTQVTIQGKAYPNSNVQVLKDGQLIGIVAADSKADFFFSTGGITPGVSTFGFWSEDQDGLRSIAFNTSFRVVEGAVTTISGVFLPPTITLDKRSIKQGETINVSGQSVPEVTVRTHIQEKEEITQEVKTAPDGRWTMAVNTSTLEDDMHTVRAMFETEDEGGTTIQSGFSQAVTFFVGDGERVVGSADLNGDGKVNLVDFSIMLFHWGTPNVIADLNGDKTVNLVDFSILLFHWTG